MSALPSFRSGARKGALGRLWRSGDPFIWLTGGALAGCLIMVGGLVLLILVNVTGLLVLKGKHGLTVRGKWLIATGALPPAIALVAFRMI